MVEDTLLAVLPPPLLSVYFVQDFITARRSEGSAAISVFAVGLVGELALPSTLLRI